MKTGEREKQAKDESENKNIVFFEVSKKVPGCNRTEWLLASGLKKEMKILSFPQ